MLVWGQRQHVCHVNVTGEWKVVELACRCLSNACWVQSCVCVRVATQLHAFIPSATSILCRLVCAWAGVLELHIRFTKFPPLPGILPFPSACQSVVTARMSRERDIPNVIFIRTRPAVLFIHIFTYKKLNPKTNNSDVSLWLLVVTIASCNQTKHDSDYEPNNPPVSIAAERVVTHT